MIRLINSMVLLWVLFSCTSQKSPEIDRYLNSGLALTIYSTVPLGKEIGQMRICVLRAINRTDTSATEFETDCAVDDRISITPNDVLNGMVTYSFKKEAADLSVTVKVIVNGYLGELQTATGEGVFTFLADTLYASGKLTLARTAPVEPDAGTDAGHDAGEDTGTDAGHDAAEDAGTDASHHPPVCADLDFSVFENSTLTEQLSATPSDATPFAFEIVTHPDHGAITDLNDETGVFTYQPTPSFTGGDEFTYKACDAYDCSNTATVTITVAAIPALSFLNGSSTHSQYHGGEIDIPVTLSFAAPGGVSVSYRLNGTAVIGDDYTDITATPGILSFSPGQTTQNISLHVVAHPDPEEDLTVEITLENLTGPAKFGAFTTHALTLIADAPKWKYVGPRPASQPSKKIAYNSQETTQHIQLTSFNSNLYMIWHEGSCPPSGANTTTQIRVKVFNGSENNPEGAFIDGGGYNGLNFNPEYSAFRPQLTAFNGTLYATWVEYAPPYNPQIRVKVYEGNNSWTWVDGGGYNGINFNPTRDATSPQLSAFNGTLYATWSENNGSKYQIRVKVYEGDNSWTWVDGGGNYGLNFNPAQNASNPQLTAFNGTLYATWDEVNSLGPNANQIRVRAYNGYDWTFVDGGGYNGINFDQGKAASNPQLTAFNGTLYATWSEYNGSKDQIRVKVYEGDNSWTWVDGGGNYGLNYSLAQNASNPQLTAFNGTLYATWTENNGSRYQIRVKVYEGDNSWTWVDGNGENGINRLVDRDAHYAQLTAHNNQLYAAWQEGNYSTNKEQPVIKLYNGNDESPGWTALVQEERGNGLNYDYLKSATTPVLQIYDSDLYAAWAEMGLNDYVQIRVGVYNGNDDNPGWTLVDGGGGYNGLNFNPEQASFNPKMSVLDPNLYLTWAENHKIRVKRYNGIDWLWVDGGDEYGINYDSSKSAFSPSLTVCNSELYALWEEMKENSSNSPHNVRAKKYNGNDASPGWTIIDGGGYNGLNFNPDKNALYPNSYCFNGTLYAIWSEENLSNIRQIRVRAYNGYDWFFVDGGGLNGMNFNPDKSVENGGYLFEFDSSLFLTWHEPNTADISQIQVRAYDEGDYSWTFVDGEEDDEGINYEPTHQAINPILLTFQSKLYAAWQERNAKGIYQIRIKEFNGDIEDPEWTATLDTGGLNGLNFDGTEPAETPNLAVLDDKLYASWIESWASTGFKQLLVYVWK